MTDLLTLPNDAELAALDGLVTPDEGRRLAYLASIAAHDIVEIGSHKGMSTCYLACGAQAGTRQRMWAVDPWDTQGKARYGGIDYAAKSVHETFLAQLEQMGVRGNVVDQKMTSLKASKGRHYPIGLLFIDASHSYRDCRDDYRAWSGFVPAGGYVAFHDYDPRFQVKRVVDEIVVRSGRWEDIQVTDTLWTARRKPDVASRAMLTRMRKQPTVPSAWGFVDVQTSDPFPPAKALADCGVIMAVFGAKAADGAAKVVASLRASGNDLPVTVVGDTVIKGADFIMWTGESPFDDSAQTGLRFLAGRVKPALYELSPYARTLYVDTDTEVLADLAPAFALLSGHDIALCAHRKQLVCDLYNRAGALWYHDMAERDATIAEWGDGGKVSFWNSGVIFFRKSKRVERVFSEWAAQWARFGHWDEQLALMRAAHDAPCKLALLSIGWNSPRRELATHIFHAYGRGVVRTDGKDSP